MCFFVRLFHLWVDLPTFHSLNSGQVSEAGSLEERDCDLIVSTKFTTGPHVFWEKEGGVEINS